MAKEKDALVKNSESKEQIEKARKKQARELIFKAEYLADVLKTYAGRRLIYEIISWSEIYGEKVSSSIQEMSYKCGQSKVGKKLIQEINKIDRNAYPKLIIEQNGGASFVLETKGE